MEPPKRIGWFAREILKKPLYPYQEIVGDAILQSIIEEAGRTFTVMFARQMGKNQLSAVLEAYLLFCMESGTIVKAAPTYKPQVVNSRLRLLSMLESNLTRDRIWKSFGYIIGLAPSREFVNDQVGPRIMLFSAGPESSIVGATASLLLEVDEAQDVASDKYNVDLKPMASTTNATTVMYGTAWSDDTLLAMQSAHNRELEELDGIQRHFEFDWMVLAAINKKYKKFVEGEMKRLGEESVSIRTQFRLLPISGAGFLFNEIQRHLLKGAHHWLNEPGEDDLYIAGIDMGGEQRPKPGEESKSQSKRDSTIISIGRVKYNELLLPAIEVVQHVWFTGMKYLDQYAAIVEIINQWNLRHITIDATGLGDTMASLLIEKFTDERVTAFKFSRTSKSKITFQLLGLVNGGRLKMYQQDAAPGAIYDEAWKQLKLARYTIPGEGIMNMGVNPGDGHDDFLLSIGLLTEALNSVTQPAQESKVIRPRRLYSGESRY